MGAREEIRPCDVTSVGMANRSGGEGGKGRGARAREKGPPDQGNCNYALSKRRRDVVLGRYQKVRTKAGKN